MTMLVALLLAFTARTFAEETNMNVSGKQMVQELTKGNISIGRNHSAATSNDLMSQSKALLRGTAANSALPGMHNSSANNTEGVRSAGCNSYCLYQARINNQRFYAYHCQFGQCLCVLGQHLLAPTYCSGGTSQCAGFCFVKGWKVARCSGYQCACTMNQWYKTGTTCK